MHAYLWLTCNVLYSVVKQEHRSSSEGWATRCARMSQAVRRGQYAVPGSAASANTTAARLAIIKRRADAGIVEFEERYEQTLSKEGRVEREERHKGRLWRRQGTHSREWSITT